MRVGSSAIGLLGPTGAGTPDLGHAGAVQPATMVRVARWLGVLGAVVAACFYAVPLVASIAMLFGPPSLDRLVVLAVPFLVVLLVISLQDAYCLFRRAQLGSAMRLAALHLLLFALVAVSALKNESVPVGVVVIGGVLAFVAAAEVASSVLMLRARGSSSD